MAYRVGAGVVVMMHGSRPRAIQITVNNTGIAAAIAATVAVH